MDTLVIFWEHFVALDFFFFDLFIIIFFTCILRSLISFCRLGLAYAGSNREDVLALILPVLGESKANMEVEPLLVIIYIYND